MSGKRPFTVLKRDVELFEYDLGPVEFEYFQKHLEAFKTMWNEQSINDKQYFVDEFFKYAEDYGYIKDIPTKIEGKNDIFIDSKVFLNENFVTEKMASAKKLVFEIALISENRERFTHGFGSASKIKDPFYNIDTRRTFRKFFGDPGHMITYKKTIFTMGLYTRFGGAVCRMLRRWVQGGVPSVSPATKQTDKKSLKKSDDKTSSKNESKRTGNDYLVAKKGLDSSVVVEDGKRPKNGDLLTDDRSKTQPSNEKADIQSVKEELIKVIEEKGFVITSTDLPVGRNGKPWSFEPGNDQSKDEAVISNEAVKQTIFQSDDIIKTNKTQNTESTQKASNTLNTDKSRTGKDKTVVNKKGDDLHLSEQKMRSVRDSQDKKIGKCHHCRCCRKVEPSPRTYKKCSWCKGKGTKFYCSKKCQIEDWQSRHREEHMSQTDCYG